MVLLWYDLYTQLQLVQTHVLHYCRMVKGKKKVFDLIIKLLAKLIIIFFMTISFSVLNARCSQNPITRSVQLPHVPVTAFSQSDLF